MADESTEERATTARSRSRSPERAEPAVEAPAVEVVEPVKPKRKRRSRKSKVKADAPAEPPKVDPEIPAALQVGLETAPPDDGADFWQEPTTDQQTGEG